MSGMVGMVYLPEIRPDEALLRAMTGALAKRGPDRQALRVLARAGFGHALLQTNQDLQPAPQPLCLGDRYWIVADARIDGREELLAELAGEGRECASDTDDCVLVLHAYLCWGEACLGHLIGDFAFAIWDAREEALFCARDHFGMKLFYYSALQDGLLFANTLQVLRLHPRVGRSVNEKAVGGFLVFGGNLDPATTAFADIFRLPPAHMLSWRRGRLEVKRYWRLPRCPAPIRYRDPHEYREQFLVLFERAVADRTRCDRVALAMSGGLDSTSIAAMANQVFRKRGERHRVSAFTMVYKHLIPDHEEPFAAAAARFLKLDWTLLTADGFDLYQDARQPPLCRWPEPLFDLPTAAVKLRLWREASKSCRVILFGEGGDEVLAPSSVANLLGRMPFHHLLGDVASSIFGYRRRPALGFRKALRRRLGLPIGQMWYPPWLEPGFERRLGFKALARQWRQDLEDPNLHRTRPAAYRDLVANWWTPQGEFSDPGLIQLPIETRFPFFDLRLVSFLMALPPLPWFIDKLLLRRAMSGKLPEELLHRRKMPLGGNRDYELLHKNSISWEDGYHSTPVLRRFVDLDTVPCLSMVAAPRDVFYHLRVKTLQFWLEDQGLGKD